MTTATTPDLSLTRVFDAPRALVYRAFTDPDHFSAWWGPIGNAIPRDEIEFDVRPGGYMRWHEFFPEDPDVWTRGSIDLTEVVEDTLLDGVMKITGHLPHKFKPFETRMRVEFEDESDGQTRVHVQQWLGEEYVAPTQNGWGEAFSKLEATLAM